MGIYYLAVTPLNFTLVSSAIWPMLVCTSASCGLSAALWFALARPSTVQLELAAALTNGVLLFNIMLHTVLVEDAHLLIYFAPIALVMSVVGPSYRVIYPSLAATGLCAFICGRFMPQAYRAEFTTALVTILFAAIGVARLLHKAIQEKAQALAAAKAAASALDEALARSETFAAEAKAAHAAKARFIANMSHEMRNPLSGMLGLIDALARTELSAVQSETVTLLERSGQMLRRIVSDVLDIEKIEAGKVVLEILPVRLAEEIGGVVRLMSAQAGAKGLALTFDDLDPDAPQVAGDPTRIKQILINLISNAIKFTAQGEVSVRLQTTAPPDAMTAHVVIEVHDTGIGFDVQNAAWLFDRFGQAEVSTTRKYGGTGLGLEISRALARQMGGDLTATSTVGVGSCFTVTLELPIVRENHAAAPASAPADLTVERGFKVLVADDNPAIRRVLGLLLEEVGAEVTYAADGQAAVDARRAREFDVILMDMHMPTLDRLEATRAINRLELETGLTPIPIVILSGNSGDEDRDAARAAGAHSFVTKPIAPQDLYGAIDRALLRQAEAA